jgi:hypothetical protein
VKSRVIDQNQLLVFPRPGAKGQLSEEDREEDTNDEHAEQEAAEDGEAVVGCLIVDQSAVSTAALGQH